MCEGGNIGVIVIWVISVVQGEECMEVRVEGRDSEIRIHGTP